jgi:hypothetical protein
VKRYKLEGVRKGTSHSFGKALQKRTMELYYGADVSAEVEDATGVDAIEQGIVAEEVALREAAHASYQSARAQSDEAKPDVPIGRAPGEGADFGGVGAALPTRTGAPGLADRYDMTEHDTTPGLTRSSAEERAEGVGTPTYLDALLSRPYDPSEPLAEYEARIMEALDEREGQGLQYDQVLLDKRLFEGRIESGLNEISAPPLNRNDGLAWVRQYYKRGQDLLPITCPAHLVDSIMINRREVLNKCVQALGGSPGSVSERFGPGLGSPLTDDARHGRGDRVKRKVEEGFFS